MNVCILSYFMCDIEAVNVMQDRPHFFKIIQ